jgi:hypothetical protein
MIAFQDLRRGFRSADMVAHQVHKDSALIICGMLEIADCLTSFRAAFVTI